MPVFGKRGEKCGSAAGLPPCHWAQSENSSVCAHIADAVRFLHQAALDSLLLAQAEDR